MVFWSGKCDLLRSFLDLYLNIVLLKFLDKRKNVLEVNLRDSICELGLNSNVIRVVNLRIYILYDYYYFLNYLVNIFFFVFKVMFRLFLGFFYFGELFLEV